MLNTNQQQPCSNCSNYFPIDRIDLHQAYCLRNIRKCPQCSQFIDIRQIDTHNQNNHKKKPCNFCKIQFLPEQLSTHSNNCSRRPKLCSFCENDVAFSEFAYHQSVCGVRTRLCAICNTNVMIREFQNGHQQKCRQRKKEQQRPQRIQRIHHNRQQQRQRDISTNMVRYGGVELIGLGGDRSLSSNRLNQKPVIKKGKDTKGYTNIIGPEGVKKVVDILPISVKLAIKNKQQNREPLRNRN